MSRHPFTLLRSPQLPAIVSDGLLFALLALVGLMASQAHAQDQADGAPTTGLAVTIDNITSVDGPLMIQILGSEAAFAGKAPASASLILPARIGSISLTLDALPPGQYAIRVMHDRDSDGELKTNLVGMPKEPWGISNNAAGNFGPPKWQDAAFTIPATAPQLITLR